MKRKNILILALLLFFTTFGNTLVFSQQEKKAKYIFFLIGDGMGEAHVALTEAYLAASNGEIGMKHLAMSNLPVIGLQKTYAENRLITGSAASGTALATGHKTNIGRISIAADVKDTLYSIALAAHNAGMRTGILTSVGINHATPAVFYAHQALRNQYYEIGLQLPKSKFDVFGGGGFINPKGNRTDTMPDAYILTENAGYKVIKTNDEFNKLKKKDRPVLMVSENILSHAEMPYAIDQKPGMLSIADFTEKAINLLDNPNGFFLMVESGKIDWAAHANDGATVIKEVIDFDNVVKKAMDFYYKHPDETLIIITADHETGGLAVGNDYMHYNTNLKLLQYQKGSLDAFNTILSDFIKKNTLTGLTFEKVLELGSDFFGISKDILTDSELSEIKKAFETFKTTGDKENLTYADANLIAVTWLKILNTKAGAGWTSHAHTASPVPVRVIGVHQELFDGFYENTDIPKKIAKISNLILKQ